MTGVAALRMYDLAEVRAPTDELWSAIASRLDDGPPDLTWVGEAGAEWADPDLVLGQTCGWPLISDLHDSVTVVGAFDYDIDGSSGAPMYRSVLIATERRSLDSLAGTIAAVNGWDSLSGCVSLGVAVADCRGPAPFFDRLLETGSHRASVEAVRSGVAAVASIDAVSYALFRKYLPDLTRGLAVVGHGPTVPTLPLITGARDPEPLQAALEATVADASTAACRERLLINGFSRTDLSSYDHVAMLGRTARDVFGATWPEGSAISRSTIHRAVTPPA